MINMSNGFDLNITWAFPEGRKIAFAFIVLLLFVLTIYGNSLNGAWHLDDEVNIVNNKYVHLKTLDWDSIQKTFYGIDQKKLIRPVAYLSFGFNYYFGRLDVFGYHAVNLTIHYLSAILLFLFIYRTLNLPRLRTGYGSSSYAVALLSAFFWAVNPLQVTAVTYIVQRMASMAGLFYILSMYSYLIARTSDRLLKKITFFVLCGIAVALALGTKENAVMLPVSLFLYDLLLIQGVTKNNFVKNLKYFVLPALIAVLVVLIFFINISSLVGDYTIRPFTMLERLLTEPRVIVFYISLLLYPTYSRLMINHDFVISKSLIDPWTTLTAILFILCCLGLAVAMARKKSLISYCIIFFFLNHFIEGSFSSLELVFEHRNYIPSMLFFVPVSVMIVYILDYFSYRTSLQLMISLLISFMLVAQGHTVTMYNFIFKDPYLLWSDNIAKAPNLSRPYNNLGNALWNRGFYDEAYKSYEKSFQLNRSDVLPLIAAPIHNMGRYYFMKKDYAEAMYHFQTAIKINPKHMPTWMNLAKTKIQMNDFKGAEGTIRQILLSEADDVSLHSILSFILLKQGAYNSAVREAWKTLAIDSEATDVLRVLAEVHRRTGHYERAVFYWEKYISKYKDDLEGHLALIELYSKTRQTEILDSIIGKVMVMKGEKSWRAMMNEYAEELASHAYEPDRLLLLSLIRNNLRNQ